MMIFIFCAALLVFVIADFLWCRRVIHKQPSRSFGIIAVVSYFVVLIYGYRIVNVLFPSHIAIVIHSIVRIVGFSLVLINIWLKYARHRIRWLPVLILAIVLVVLVPEYFSTQARIPPNKYLAPVEQLAKQRAVEDLGISRWDISNCDVNYVTEAEFCVVIKYTAGGSRQQCSYYISMDENESPVVIGFDNNEA